MELGGPKRPSKGARRGKRTGTGRAEVCVFADAGWGTHSPPLIVELYLPRWASGPPIQEAA
jgi:hypothetical protein